MNGQCLSSSFALKSKLLDDHLSKVNSQYGCNFTFGKQFHFRANSMV